MNQYLVAIHYIQLLQAELDILNHDARLLFDLKIEPNLAKRELADLKVSLSKLSDKNLYIEGTIWYQPSLFAIIDQNLGVIDDWLKELVPDDAASARNDGRSTAIAIINGLIFFSSIFNSYLWYN